MHAYIIRESTCICDLIISASANNRSLPKLSLLASSAVRYCRKSTALAYPRDNSYKHFQWRNFCNASTDFEECHCADETITVASTGPVLVRPRRALLMPPLLVNRNDKSMCDRLLVMWTKEEDDILRDQVKLHGIDKWARIATHLCGKTSRQCRRRWHMFLNVVNKRGGWSADEDKLLLEAHSKFGNRWTEIAKKLPGRTDNAVKNRFCVLCKKQTKGAQICPLQRRLNGSNDSKQKLQERRFLEGPKIIHGIGGVSKKMRTEAPIHNRTRDLELQQRPLEEKLQQWKGLKSSEVLTNSPHLHRSLEANLHPWKSLPSDMPAEQTTQEDRHHGWKQFPLDGKGGHVCDPQTSLQGKFSLQAWEGLHLGAEDNGSICPEGSIEQEAAPSSTSPAIHKQLSQESLQKWNREKSVEASSNFKHQQRAVVLEKSHSMWCGLKTTVASPNASLHPRPGTKSPEWLDGKTLISDPASQQREVDQALHQWEKTSQDSATTSLHHQRSVDENLPPLSEINSLGMAYMTTSTESTVVGGMQRWLTMQTGKHGEHRQHSSADGVLIWDHSLATEPSDSSSQPTAKDDTRQWQDWNSSEANTSSPCQQRPLECTMRADSVKPGDSADLVAFEEVTVKQLQVWATSNCQATGVLQQSDGHQLHEWEHSRSETGATGPHLFSEDRAHRSEVPDSSSSLLSMLNRFQGSDINSNSQLLTYMQAGFHKSHLIEETWKTAVEKLKFASTTVSTDAHIQKSREVLEFEECTPKVTRNDGLNAVATFSPSTESPQPEPSKGGDAAWELQTNLKNVESSRTNGVQMLPGGSTTCERSSYLSRDRNDEVEVMEIEGQLSGVSDSPPSNIPTDGVHSPTQIIPRSNRTMECMPSPQFSDSEKEFLLSTLDQNTSYWPSSPLRPQFRFSKVRNPLIDIRYDTPARSPLSSCLLRQFQVSETSRLA